jgi:hypothetical protein
VGQIKFTSIAHLHAVSHSQDLLDEARQARLLAEVRATGGSRPGGVRRQVGLVLIRAGEFVRGAEAPMRKAA